MWHCCPNCASKQDPNTRSCWNDETGERIGLEFYSSQNDAGTPLQNIVLGIKNCPEHANTPRPQPLEYERNKLEDYLARINQKHGGIIDGRFTA